MSIGELILWTVLIIGSSGLWLGLPIAIINVIADPDGKKEDAKRKEQQKKWENKRKTEQEQFEANNRPPEGNSWQQYREIVEQKHKEKVRVEENARYYQRGLGIITHVVLEENEIKGIYPSTAYKNFSGWTRAEIFEGIRHINSNGFTISELCANLPNLELISFKGADMETLKELAVSGKKLILRDIAIKEEILPVLSQLELFPILLQAKTRLQSRPQHQQQTQRYSEIETSEEKEIS